MTDETDNIIALQKIIAGTGAKVLAEIDKNSLMYMDIEDYKPDDGTFEVQWRENSPEIIEAAIVEQLVGNNVSAKFIRQEDRST